MTAPLPASPVVLRGHSLHIHGINAVAAGQRSLITGPQLRSLGYNRDAVGRLMERGILRRFRQSVYEVAGAAPDMWRPLMAVVLAVGQTCLASHFASLGLYGFVGILPGAVEVTVLGRASGDLSDVTVHETRRWTECRVVSGIAATTPARSIADIAPLVHISLLGKLVDEYQRRGLGSLQMIRDAAPKRIPRDLQRVLSLRVEEAIDLEGVYLRHIRELGLPAPVLQHQVTIEGRTYLIDFAWPTRKVGLEPKGWVPHGTRTAFDHDANREGALTAAGWRLIPATTTIDPLVALGRVARLLTP